MTALVLWRLTDPQSPHYHHPTPSPLGPSLGCRPCSVTFLPPRGPRQHLSSSPDDNLLYALSLLASIPLLTRYFLSQSMFSYNIMSDPGGPKSTPSLCRASSTQPPSTGGHGAHFHRNIPVPQPHRPSLTAAETSTSDQ